MTFERIHEIGAKRHPEYWFTANAAAARAIPPDKMDDATKTLVSLVTLRVLDAIGGQR